MYMCLATHTIKSVEMLTDPLKRDLEEIQENENTWISNGIGNPGKMNKPILKLDFQFYNDMFLKKMRFPICPGLVIPFEIYLFSIFLDLHQIQF